MTKIYIFPKSTPMYKKLGEIKSTEIYRKNRFSYFNMWQYYALMVACIILTNILNYLFVIYVPQEFAKNHQILFLSLKAIVSGIFYGVFFGMSIHPLVYMYIVKTKQFVHVNDATTS